MFSQTIQRFKFAIGLSAILSFLVMTLGSLVRATDSGLACPDWPLCFNQAVPLFDTQIFLEWFHRMLAAVLTVVVVYAVIIAVRHRELKALFGKQLIAACSLLVFQIVLGGLTVLQLLDPKVVSLHLINAVVFYSILVWLFLSLQRHFGKPKFTLELPRSKYGWFYAALAVVVFLQIYLGGLVSTNHAGLVCPDFPTCHGKWFPGAAFLLWLQMVHRYLAFLLLAGVLLLATVSRHDFNDPMVTRFSQLLPLLVFVQILLGVANVYWQLPVWASVLHLANALMIYTGLLTATVITFQNKQSQVYGEASGRLSRLTIMREAGL